MKVNVVQSIVLALTAAGPLLFTVPAGAQAQQQPQRSVWDSVYTAKQAQAGNDLYQKTCASCHGTNLAGDGYAPALQGGTFMANWNGVTVGDLVDRIHTSMPQDNPGSLSTEQAAAVTAYLLKMNGFPAGGTALPRQSGILKGIMIDAYAKPSGQ